MKPINSHILSAPWALLSLAIFATYPSCVYAQKKLPAESPTLKSFLGDFYTKITFANKSGRRVKIYWINYQGQRELVETLNDGDWSWENSYLTHPWVVTDENDNAWYLYDPDAQPRTINIILPSSVIAEQAIDQFKLGNIDQSHELLRRAIRKGPFQSDHELLNKARALIDPPSTRPADDFATSLGSTAWDILRLPDQPSSKYKIALQVARNAVSIDPTAYNYSTLGAGLFRTGNYADAIAALNHAHSIDFVAAENRARDLAFLAMSEQKLGHRNQAVQLLQQLAELAKDPDALTNNDESLQSQATTLIATTHPTTIPQPATTK
jgi:tetratricopeptide (TPR) repeat protein